MMPAVIVKTFSDCGCRCCQDSMGLRRAHAEGRHVVIGTLEFEVGKEVESC